MLYHGYRREKRTVRCPGVVREVRAVPLRRILFRRAAVAPPTRRRLSTDAYETLGAFIAVVRVAHAELVSRLRAALVAVR